MDKSKMTMKELREAGVSPEEAGQLFASRYDPTIQSLVGVLRMFGMGDEQYHAYLDEAAERLGAILPEGDVPDDLSVEESQPWVEVSDLMVIGVLADAWYRFGMANPSTVTEALGEGQ